MTTPELENSREIPRELLQEILLTLPTRDVARSSCVSRLWRDSARDPSFRSLHGKASHVIGGAAETLLVSEKRKHGCNDEAGVFNVSSGEPLCHVPIINGYVLSNVCNGFLCFAHGGRRSGHEAPVLVCNPATGETVKLPDPPPFACRKKTHLFALGFSPPTNEYKLFRLSSNDSVKSVEVDVYTLGDSAGEWRRLSYRSVCRPTEVWAPVLIDGKLYVAALPWKKDRYSRQKILIVDVFTEMCHTYDLPYDRTRLWDDKSPVNAFELNGELCFVVHTIYSWGSSQTVDFWVMSPPPQEDNDDYDSDMYLDWDLFYSFHMEGYYIPGSSCVGWLGEDGMLCYMHGSTLYKYDTRGQRSLTDNNDGNDDDDDYDDEYDDDDDYNNNNDNNDDDNNDDDNDDDDILKWEQQVDVPMTPLLPGCRWPNIYGGYRPTLLSPLTLLPQDGVNDGNRYQLGHTTLSTLTKH